MCVRAATGEENSAYRREMKSVNDFAIIERHGYWWHGARRIEWVTIDQFRINLSRRIRQTNEWL